MRADGAAGCQHVLDNAQTERKAEIQPHRMSDDLGVEAVTAIERIRGNRGYARLIAQIRQPSVNFAMSDRMPDAMRVRRQTVEHAFGTIQDWIGRCHFLTPPTQRRNHVLAYNLKREVAIPGARMLMKAMRASEPSNRRRVTGLRKKFLHIQVRPEADVLAGRLQGCPATWTTLSRHSQLWDLSLFTSIVCRSA
ncbi:hypothetical protein SAMN04488498_12657 [Mesorhizobium albiziae]|uniref:Transposase DDE domain-containing protein n=1 Tax=Neomesorhizobium albiziae TaxID=335020 RepID=A0A1I4EGZ8_9HYPH|nr:hypothetical protein SAMN04488498_12657 [Mesorhizobium albiziae]